MSLQKLLFSILSLSLQLPPLYSQSKGIDIDKNTIPLSEISKISKKVESITFKTDKTQPFVGLDEILFIDQSIVVIAREESKNPLPFKVLQFDLEGKLIKQIGDKHPNRISLLFDSSLKQIGINDNKTVKFYSENGQYLRSIQSIAQKMVSFDSNYLGVKLVSGGIAWHYDLTLSDNQGENKEIIWSYNNPADFLVGLHPVYSNLDNELYISTQLDRTLYAYRNGVVEPAYILKSKNKLRDGIRLVDGWIITTTIDSRRGGQRLHYYNLIDKKNFTAHTIIKSDHITTTIKNDFGNSETLVPFQGKLIGQTRKTIAFRDEKPLLSDNSYTIYLVKLK